MLTNRHLKETLDKIFTARFKTSALLILILMAFYTLIRIIFYIAGSVHYVNFSPGMLFLSFIHGLKFDASALMMVNLLFLFLYNLPMKTMNKLCSRALLVFFCLLTPFSSF